MPWHALHPTVPVNPPMCAARSHLSLDLIPPHGSWVLPSEPVELEGGLLLAGPDWGEAKSTALK